MSRGADIGAGEQIILASQGDGAQRAFRTVVIRHAVSSTAARLPEIASAYLCRVRIGVSGAMNSGQAAIDNELRARVVIWPPLRLAWLRCERESVVVV